MEKKEYIKPEMKVYEETFSLLAGSLNIYDEDADDSEIY